jgi:hypothetical protein
LLKTLKPITVFSESLVPGFTCPAAAVASYRTVYVFLVSILNLFHYIFGELHEGYGKKGRETERVRRKGFGIFCQGAYILPRSVYFTKERIFYQGAYILPRSVYFAKERIFYQGAYILPRSVYFAKERMFYQGAYILPRSVYFTKERLVRTSEGVHSARSPVDADFLPLFRKEGD